MLTTSDKNREYLVVLGCSVMVLCVRVMYHCVVSEFERKKSGHSLERLMKTITCMHKLDKLQNFCLKL